MKVEWVWAQYLILFYFVHCVWAFLLYDAKGVEYLYLRNAVQQVTFYCISV